jgi:hypothetical protein
MNYLRWIAGLGLVAACGGSAPQSSYATTTTSLGEEKRANVPEVHKRGTDKLVVVVGPAGGTLELDNGARLAIPAGALAEAVEVTFANGARTTAFSNHDYERPVGPTLDVVIEGDGLQQAPVEVSIPIPKLPEGFAEKDLGIGVEVPAQQRAVQGQGTNTRWDYLTAKATGSGRAVASLEQVAGYRVQFVVSKTD